MQNRLTHISDIDTLLGITPHQEQQMHEHDEKREPWQQEPFDLPLPNGQRPSEMSESALDEVIAGAAPRDELSAVFAAPSEDFSGEAFEVNVGKEVMCAVLEDTIEALTDNAGQDVTDAERVQRQRSLDTLTRRLAWAEKQSVVNFWVQMKIDE